MPAYESMQSGSSLAEHQSHAHGSGSKSPNSRTIGSDVLIKTPVPEKSYEPRIYYIRNRDKYPPPHIAYSHFIPRATVEFLMRWKKDSACGVKFESYKSKPDRITNLEGALHTFVTPIVRATIHGDYRWGPGHGVHGFGASEGFQLGRPVLISALIQQDFEDRDVMVRVAGVDKERTKGVSNLPVPLTTKEKHDDLQRMLYDNAIRQYLVYHLTRDHELPNTGAIKAESLLSKQEALNYLAAAIENTKPHELPDRFRDVFLSANYYVLSLEIMFNTAVHQIRNELLLLEDMCSDTGYVYTFNPPAIFVRILGEHGTELLSRIHVAALKYFASTTKLEHFKVFAWANFNSPLIVGLLRRALASQPHIIVMSNDELFSGNRKTKKTGHGLYTPPKGTEGAMLVIHNNSDAFGQNIDTEPSGGSLDGVVGAYSSAAASLMRDRKDLCDHLMEIRKE